MPRATKTTPTGKARHDPLLVQLREDDVEAKYGRVSKPGRRAKRVGRRDGDEERADEGETILDPKTSRKIFELARDQQVELGVLDDDEGVEEDEDSEDDAAAHRHRAPPVNMGDDDDDLEEEVEYEEYEIDAEDEFQIDSGDMQALDALLPANSGERRTLADLIFAKIEDAEANGGQTAVIQPSARKDSRPDPAEGLNPKVVEVYRKVGQLLSKYTSGPLPKPFKIVPSLPAWARILALTEPENWSPQAAHAATRIFVSQMKPAQARVYLEGVLLDAVREDIRNRATDKGNRPLHPHYYEALRRAVYKPGAFFKGIVFPLLETGCTLKEAAIIASVLAKKKVPMLHSSAALLRLAEMEHYTGPNSLFIRVLIDKKYALPYKVVDALVFHFIRLSNTYKAKGEKLPVLWHQSLLTFCQRYASDLTPDQKDALLDVIRATPHAQIGPEVRRELVSSVERGAPREPGMGGDGLDVEMG